MTELDTNMLAILAFVINLIVVLSSVIWSVARIKSTADVLNEAVNGLKAVVETLRMTVDKLDDRTVKHAERIATLEGKTEDKE